MDENTINNMYKNKDGNATAILQSYSYISGYLIALRNNQLITMKRYDNLNNLNEKYFLDKMEILKKEKVKQ